MHTIIAVSTLAVALFGLVFVGPPASAKGKCIPATACGPQACYHWCDQYRAYRGRREKRVLQNVF